MHAAPASPATGRPLSMRLAADAEPRHAGGGAPSPSASNAVRVVLRCRPLLEHELASRNAVSSLRFPHDTAVDVVMSADSEGEVVRRYEYSRVCSPAVAQEAFFHASGVKALMDRALEGYNVSCLAYGQTGAGKTYTMLGPPRDRADVPGASEDGIVPRAITYLFERIRAEPGPPVTIRASMCEIYNENVLDLLNFTGEALSLKWSREKGFFVAGQVVVTCEGLGDVMAVLAEGERNRAVGSHALNRDSSRSHSLMTLWIERGGTATQARVASKAIFVDLAGSERLKETKSEGTTAVETRYINKSLHVLGKVISMLADAGAGGGGSAPAPPPPGSPSRVRQVRALQRANTGGSEATAGGEEVVTLAAARRAASASGGGGSGAGGSTPLLPPFRDSKLTKLLADALGGNAFSVMIACVSAARSCLDETRNTLSYASRAMAIQSAPVVQHVDFKEAIIAGLRRQVNDLLAENGLLRAHIGVPGDLPPEELPFFLEDVAAEAAAAAEEAAAAARSGGGPYSEGAAPAHGVNNDDNESVGGYLVPPGMLARGGGRRGSSSGAPSAGRSRRDPRAASGGAIRSGGALDGLAQSASGYGTPARSPFPSPPPTTGRVSGVPLSAGVGAASSGGGGSHVLLPPLTRGRGVGEPGVSHLPPRIGSGSSVPSAIASSSSSIDGSGAGEGGDSYLARVAARAARSAAEKRAEELEAENAALRQARDAAAARVASLSVTLDTYRANVAKLQRQLLEAQLRAGSGGGGAPAEDSAAATAVEALRDANHVLQSQVLALQQREITLIQSVAAGGRAAPAPASK